MIVLRNQVANEKNKHPFVYREKPVFLTENLHELPDRTGSLAGSDYDIE
jgi:hypothetical protein